MDDAWEIEWFGDLSQDGDADFDSDSLSNVFEFELGLDPTNGDSNGDGDPDWFGIPTYLSREIWIGIPGASLDDLRNSAKFGDVADQEVFVPDAMLAADLADNYGMRVRGRVIAPVDGDFRFILDASAGAEISGGENGDSGVSDGQTGQDLEMWLGSTEAASSRNLVIASPGAALEPVVTSGWITLEAGKEYFIEILMKAGTGADNLKLGWEYPGQARELIPLGSLRSYVPANVDADGLPDEWEMKYFGDLNQVATNDPDNDGFDNSTELAMRSDPNDPGDPAPPQQPTAISINVGGNGSLAAGDVAGVIGLANWNDFSNVADPASSNLIDSNGNPIAGFSFSASGALNSFDVLNTPDKKMMSSWMGTPSLELSGIPYDSYKLIIYYDSWPQLQNGDSLVASYALSSNGVALETLYGVNKKDFSLEPDVDPDWDEFHALTLADANEEVANGDGGYYLVFEGLSSPDLSLTAKAATGDFVYDPVADLTWYDVNDGNKGWDAATGYAATLDVGGVDDWRLPTASELSDLIIGDGVNGVSFPFTHSGLITNDGAQFWTSTEEGPGAVALGNDDAFYNPIPKDNGIWVVAVRSGAIGSVSGAPASICGIQIVLDEDFVDSDADGLLDAWELEHFGDLAQGGGDDPDGDGLSNIEEQAYGGDPNAPSELTYAGALSVNIDRWSAAEGFGQNVDPLEPSETAGLHPVGNWNAFDPAGRGGFHGAVPLDDSGAEVGVFSVVGSDARGVSWNTGLTGDGKMFGDMFIGSGTLEITGIPYANYEIIVYSKLYSVAPQSFTLGGVTRTVANYDSGWGLLHPYERPQDFETGAGSLGVFAEGVHYARFVGLTGASQTLDHESMAGFQIVEVVAEAFTEDPVDPDDTDGDGLLDAWELEHFGDLGQSGDDDPDGDGLTNWREYQLGSDPAVQDSIAGALTRELWMDVPGESVDDLRDSPVFLGPPTVRGIVHGAEAVALDGNSGGRLRGYITAPEDGDYLFLLSGYQDTEMWLSTDADKFNRQKLVEPTVWTDRIQTWHQDASQRSAPVALEAGQKYYVEIWHKGEVRSNVSAGWQRPGGGVESIPAEFLSTYLPQADDADDDDLPDAWELANGLDPQDNGSGNPANGAAGDLDGDGLSNISEYRYGTHPGLADSNGDGVSDYDEIEIRKLLGPDVVVGEVGDFQLSSTVAGSAYSAHLGTWGSAGASAYTRSVRGWLEYPVDVPAAGVYLIDLEFGPRSGGVLSDDYEAVFSVDGVPLGTVAAEIGIGETGHAKVLSPWLEPGQHTVRVYINNALTLRQVAVHGLSLFSSHGSDADGDGTPDWVAGRVATANGIESPATSGKVSPFCLEGRARHIELVALAGAGTAEPRRVPGGRWYTDVELDPDAATTVSVDFENGALSQARSLTWEPTNLLEESSLTLRAGDALLLTAHHGRSADGSDKVWLTIGGQTDYFKGNEPLVYDFPTAGTYVIDVLHRTGNGNAASETAHSVTLSVVAMPEVESPVFVPGWERDWDVALPDGAVLEVDSEMEIVSTTDLGGGLLRHNIHSESIEPLSAVVRLGEGGPVLGDIAIRPLRLWDADRTSMLFAGDFGDGSYQVDMPSVVSEVYDDIVVNYDIFLPGVTFLPSGAINLDLLASDYDELGSTTLQFLKVTTDGSACHRTSIWQNGRRIAYLY